MTLLYLMCDRLATFTINFKNMELETKFAFADIMAEDGDMTETDTGEELETEEEDEEETEDEE